MSNQLVARGFDLAEAAVRAENSGQIQQAKELFTSAIECFRGSLALGQFKDANSKSLIEKEVKNLVARRTEMLQSADKQKQFENRLQDIKSTELTEKELKKRLDDLKGSQKTISTDELQERLIKLNGEEDALKERQIREDNPFFKDDEWRRGLDPEIQEIMEKARDEASLI